VKHNIYILLHACSAALHFLFSCFLLFLSFALLFLLNVWLQWCLLTLTVHLALCYVRVTPHGFCGHLDLVSVLGLQVKILTRGYVLRNHLRVQSVNCEYTWLCPWGWSGRSLPHGQSNEVDMVRGKKGKTHDMRRPVVSPRTWITVRRQGPRKL